VRDAVDEDDSPRPSQQEWRLFGDAFQLQSSEESAQIVRFVNLMKVATPRKHLDLNGRRAPILTCCVRHAVPEFAIRAAPPAVHAARGEPDERRCLLSGGSNYAMGTGSPVASCQYLRQGWIVASRKTSA
jgi:hypothetical protein